MVLTRQLGRCRKRVRHALLRPARLAGGL